MNTAVGVTVLRRLCFAIVVAWVTALLVACSAPPEATDSTTTETTQPTPQVAASTDDDPFIDATSSSGLEFVHWNGMSGEFYFLEMMGAGAALFDYDNDGDLDVYLVQGNLPGTDKTAADAQFPPPGTLPLSDRLLRNDLEIDASGKARVRFVDVTEESRIAATEYGMGVATGDFNNDGFVDLYLTNFGPNQLWRNNGDGTFSEVAAQSGADERRWSVPAAVLDFDRDGWLDLYVGNYVDYQIATHKRCTDELGAPNYCGPLAFAAVVDTLLHNRGDGTFEDWSARSGIREAFGGALGAASGDFNGDAWPDIYVGNDGMPNQLWINRGDGTFEDQSLLAGCAVNGEGRAEASMGMSAADFDNDGDEDLFIAHLQQETNTVYVNDGQAIFEDRSAETGLGAPSFEMTGFGAAWFDYDNDGRLDQLTVNGAVKVIKSLALTGDPFPLHQKNQLFHQLSDGTFEEVSERAGPAFDISEVSRGVAFGDVDNDGDVDVLITNNSGPARLLLNQVGQDRSWIGLRLVGQDGKREAIGAWVGLERLGATPLWRRVTTTASYGSSNDPRLLFGLGEADGVAGVKVRWPDGSWEQWDEKEWGEGKLGRYHTLHQGEGRPIEDRS